MKTRKEPGNMALRERPEPLEPHDAGAGDWRGWWEQYGPRLLLFARQQAQTLDEAEDIVQEAVVRYWKSRGTCPDLSPVLLFTYVKRVAVDFVRQAASRQTREAEACRRAENDPLLFESPLEQRERIALIETSLRALPQEQRETVVLKIWAGLTFEEIGQTLGISPNTAASRYRYALTRLRTALAPVFQ